jgi:hypothetical protein
MKNTISEVLDKPKIFVLGCLCGFLMGMWLFIPINHRLYVENMVLKTLVAESSDTIDMALRVIRRTYQDCGFPITPINEDTINGPITTD